MRINFSYDSKILHNTREFIDIFAKKNSLLFKYEQKNGFKNHFFAKKQATWDKNKKIAILIDRQTNLPGQIIAKVLSNQKNVFLVGETPPTKTFIYQKIYLKNGILKYPDAQLLDENEQPLAIAKQQILIKCPFNSDEKKIFLKESKKNKSVLSFINDTSLTRFNEAAWNEGQTQLIAQLINQLKNQKKQSQNQSETMLQSSYNCLLTLQKIKI